VAIYLWIAHPGELHKGIKKTLVGFNYVEGRRGEEKSRKVMANGDAGELESL